MRNNLLALQGLNRENLGWSTNQLQLELDRFRRVLAQFSAQNEGVTPERVNARFDLLWSRVALTQEGTVGARLRALDAGTQTIPLLLDTLEANETRVTGLKPGDTATAALLSAEFDKLDVPVRNFARNVFVGENDAIGELRDKLRNSVFFTAIATLLAFAISGIALAFVNRESSIHRKMAASNLKLAHAAEAAHKTKSRFLTMMSHELRTPMNGVLGMLALAKQRGLSEPQRRIIEQAERSGKQMISMLSDILDYSALQDERMVLEEKPFEPRQLALAIQELFGAVAKREGIAFTVSCDAQCPKRVLGDMRRVRQIVAHFASYIVETAATRDVEIDIGYADENLQITISFDYGKSGASGPNWRPEILTATTPENAEAFATDSLGPAVARGVLERMGGRVWLDYSDDNRIAIIISAPASDFTTDKVVIHIDTQSESLKAICRMAMAGDNVLFRDEGVNGTVQFVLFEAGGQNEISRLSEIRQEFGNAILIALGDPLSVAEFDDVVGIPLNIEELRDCIGRRISDDGPPISANGVT